MKLRVLLATALVALTTTVVDARPAAAAVNLTGGGSSFAAPEIDAWRAETAVNPYNLSINYVAQGSSFGRTSFYSNTLEFGASDISYTPFELDPLKNSPRCSGKAIRDCFVYVPVSAGGVSFMYNLTDRSGNRVQNLQLTRDAACKIFTGAIKKWNDPELVATNPFLRGIDHVIGPQIRADGAGESYVLSEFCIAVDKPAWTQFIAQQRIDDPTNIAPDFAGGQPVSNWPKFPGANSIAGADNLANFVARDGPYAITYVATAYAKRVGMPVASLQNAAGVYTQPDEENVTVALGYARPNPSADAEGTFILNFTGADPRAYFPSTYSYVLAQTTGWPAEKGAALGQFLCYAISAGQGDAVPLRYARLSAPIVDISINAISKIPGAPRGKDACYVAGAAPPPPPPTVQPGQGTIVTPVGNGLAGTGAPGSGNGTSVNNGASTGKTGGTTSSGKKSGKNAWSKSNSNTTDDTLAQISPDQLLADASHQATPEDKSVSGIWVLLGGVVIAWLITALVSRRRTAQ